MAQSLIGKADATLVNAAFKEASSQIPADMSGIMETMTETQKELDKQFVDMTTKLFGDINASNEEMKGLVDPIYKSLQNGTFSDQDMMSFKGVLDGFRDEWKLIPKGKDGDDARMQWKNKVNRFNNTITSFDQKLLELSANISGENYIPAGLQGLGGRDADKNLKFLNSIYRLKSGKEGNKATMSVDEKGDVFFTSTIDGEEIKMSMQEISDLMPKKDITIISGVDKLVMANGKKVGATKGSVYDPTSISDGVFKLLNNAKVPRDAFQTLAHYDYGGGSFFQDLYSPSGPMGKTIVTALKGLQYSDNAKEKFDKDGVPGITAGDFTYNNGENRKAIADYIMSNDKIGRKVLSKWFAATEGQSAFNAGRNLIPPDKKTSTSGSNTIDLFNKSERLIPMNQFQTAVKQLDGEYVIVKNSDVSKDHSKLQSFSAEDIIKSLGGVVESKAQTTTETSSDINREKISMLFGPDAEEEQAETQLRKMFPGLTINDVFGFNEKIKINGKPFNLRKPNDPEEGLEALLEHIEKINEFAE